VLRAIRRAALPHWTDGWPDIVARAAQEPFLHLGSGRQPVPNAVTADINSSVRPNVVVDLNNAPWPFADDTFAGVVALSVFEHLDDFLKTMGEVHRVLRRGGCAHILVPHFSSSAAFVDPTHKQRLSARSCDYFIPGTSLYGEYGFYVPFRFELVERHVHLSGSLRYVPLLELFARRFTTAWEDQLCFVLRGDAVFWQLRAIK
jgi:SAM-dependent methyltransferase